MKKVFPWMLLLLLPVVAQGKGYPYPKSLDNILPAEMIYEEEFTNVAVKTINPANVGTQGKKVVPLRFIKYVFTTNAKFQETMAKLAEKGIRLKMLDKRKVLENLKADKKSGQKTITKIGGKNYQLATGIYQNWVVQLSTHYIDPETKDILKLTTLTFTTKSKINRNQ